MRLKQGHPANEENLQEVLLLLVIKLLHVVFDKKLLVICF